MPAHGLVFTCDANARQEEQVVLVFNSLGVADSGVLPAIIHALANAAMFAKHDFFHLGETTTAIALVRKVVAA
ncbi:MAG: hypothetical protein SOI46_04925 [Eggerthellaceae bacterium]|jgi:thiamine monophosphate synthase